MSNFVVSARKYRPIRFDDVVGQAHISQTLKNAIRQNHLAQAFLFCGPRGVGKTTCARILAKVLNCQRPTADTEPCDECDSCLAFNKNASLNIHELDAASNNSVEHIRALIEQVRFAPQSGRYKIYIIDEVHMLSQAAFNAFLKTLEEPPSYAIFILATTEKHKIIPTILSRCQIFDFNRIQIADMSAHLQRICEREGIQAEEEGLNVIAQKADGALRDALSIFDRVVSFSGNAIRYQDVIEQLNILDYDYYFQVVEAVAGEEVSRLLLLFDTILQKGFEGDIFINGLAQHLRNVLVCQDAVTAQLLEVSGNIRQRYMLQAKMVPTGLILSALSLCNDCDVHYKLARNKRLHVEMTLIRMAYIRQAVRLTQLPPAGNNPAPLASEKKNLDLNTTPLHGAVTEEIPPFYQPQPLQEPKREKDATPPQHTPPAEQPPAQEGGNNNKLDLIKRLSQAGRGGLLQQVQESLQAERVKELPPPPLFNLTNLQAFWDDYTQQLTSASTQTIFKNAKLALATDSNALLITVGGALGRDAISRDTALWAGMKTHFQKPDISYDIVIEEPTELAVPTAPKKNLPMDDRAKYVHFLNQNPLLKELQKRLQLFPAKK